MIRNFYSIRDVKAQVFNRPFEETNNETAKRAFIQSAEDQPHIADYVLYHVGAFDDVKGCYIPNAEPVQIFTGMEINPAKADVVDMQA
jgi:hypothetical protein